MCIIIKKESFKGSNITSSETTVYKILLEKSGNLYSPERGVIWSETIGKKRSINKLSTIERIIDGINYISTEEGLYSYKHRDGCFLLLFKGKTKEERKKYRVFKSIIPKGSEYIDDKYQVCSTSLILTEDITEEIMREIKNLEKPND